MRSGDSVGVLYTAGEVDLGVRTRPRPDGAVQSFAVPCAPCGSDGGTGVELLFDAVVEPDVDADGMGDESQDPDGGGLGLDWEDDWFDDYEEGDELDEDLFEDASPAARRQLRLLDADRRRGGGATLLLRVPRAGRVRAAITLPSVRRTGAGPFITILTGDVRARHAGRVRLRLDPTTPGARLLARRPKLRTKVVVSQSSRTAPLKVLHALGAAVSRSTSSAGRASAGRWPESTTPASHAEAGRRQLAHEVEREQPVVAAGDHARRHVRPRVERPAVRERRAGLARLAAGERVGDDVLRHVVEERGAHVERRIGVAALAHVLRALGRLLPAARPPAAGRLAGRGDHRRDEHEARHVGPRARHRGAERRHRLRDEDDVAPVADRRHGRVGVLGQARGVVGGGQVDGDRLVAAIAQQRHDAVPVPRVAARAGQEHVRVGSHAGLTPGRSRTHRAGCIRCDSLSSRCSRSSRAAPSPAARCGGRSRPARGC